MDIAGLAPHRSHRWGTHSSLQVALRRSEEWVVLRQAVAAFCACFTASVQAAAPLSLPCSTFRRTFSTATRTCPLFLPRYCGVRFFAVSEKILPTGASLKNGFLKSTIAGSA